jgi:hypothetical protein
MLPRELVKWCAVRLMSYSTLTESNRDKTPSEISIMDALQAWD